MEKSEFRVLIKNYFLREKILSETKAKLDKYYAMEWFRSGLPNFVVAWAQKPYQVKMSQETNPEVGRERPKNPEKWSRNIGKKARNKVQLVQFIIIELAKKVLIFE